MGSYGLNGHNAMTKTEHNVMLIPNVICDCTILYNVLLSCVEVDVERLLDVIDNEETGSGVSSQVEGDIDDVWTSNPRCTFTTRAICWFETY